VLAQAYHWRWIGSETALKEAKSAISGAGPSTGPMLRSASPALVSQEHAAWVTAVELARATARTAAAAVPARRGRRAGLPAALTTAARDRALAALARRRVTIDRDRHRDRKTKARPGFPAGGPRLATRTAHAEISVCRPPAS
jgi:hypothetical protein